LASDLRTLTQWLSHDILALAGPVLATRQALFDFVVEELSAREPQDARRIRPVRVALQNQRDDLLAFAGVLDEKLATIAQAAEVSGYIVRSACLLHRKPTTSPAYWQGWNGLQSQLAPDSRPCSPLWRAPWSTRRAAVRWLRTSTRGCDLTSRCVAIWANRTWTCCDSSLTIDASCGAEGLNAKT
jgi:hypothetical protein